MTADIWPDRIPEKPPNIVKRQRWAFRFIRKPEEDRPEYGSTGWLELPDDHPDKVAACVVAAECWATAGDHIEEDLRREIEVGRATLKRIDDQEYQTQAAAHRERYKNPSMYRHPSSIGRGHG